ncbi:MAG TPA: aminoacyl-tRNA hydrolase [Anaerolineae bacterium]|nr:aminoacyl-tRNA hydrolase [Anaerolineae bacterium]
MNEDQVETYLVIGLGNPGREHRLNRHNAGFMLLDLFAEDLDLTFSRLQAHALITDGHFEGHKVILAKPQTFMNASGRSTGLLARFYRIPPSNMLVVLDDIDLTLGTIKLLEAGGSAGHKGMRSIFNHLGTQEFPRLRIGIGRPPGRMDPADYVLQDFSSDELPVLKDSLDRAVQCLRLFLQEGIQAAMNCCNTSAACR